MFFCIPIVFGCPTHVKPEGDQTPRLCPHCHNNSVVPMKTTQWFELFWVPLIPFSRKHVWACTICQWNAPHAAGQFEPALGGSGGGYPRPYQQWSPPAQPGYVPAYLGTPNGKQG